MKTCKHGHAMTKANTYMALKKATGKRYPQCRACRKIQNDRGNALRPKKPRVYVKRDACACGRPYDLVVKTTGVRRCSHCKHNNWLRYRYKITLAEYEKMLRKQNGGCAICGGGPGGRKRWFCVDHDHVTGLVRALLCDPCNRGIELFREDPVALRKAAAYITKHTPECRLVPGGRELIQADPGTY